MGVVAVEQVGVLERAVGLADLAVAVEASVGFAALAAAAAAVAAAEPAAFVASAAVVRAELLWREP